MTWAPSSRIRAANSKLNNTTTAGFSGGWISLDDGDDDYVNLTGFLRYYPQGAALTGFFFGGKFGVHRVESTDEDGTALGFGIDLSVRFGLRFGLRALVDLRVLEILWRL